jgi:hypothetical protein
MTPPRQFAWAGFAALLLCATAGAAEYVKQQGAGTLRLQPDNSKAPENVFKVEDGLVESRLSTKLLLTLSIEGPAPLKVDGGDEAALESLVKALKDSGLWFSCEPAGPPTHTAAVAGRDRWEAAIRLSPLPPRDSTIEFRPASVKYTDGAGEEHTIVWQPVKLRVTTTVASLDVKKELRDITPPEDPPPAPLSWTRWLPWAGIATAVAGLVAGGWGLRRRFAPVAPPLAPHEWAARELDRLEALQLPEAGEAERYHTLLSDVVRVYLERRFSLPASQQTTAEFLETMRRSPQLTPAQQGLLRDFLERCDMAKFARAAPPPEECRALAAMARSFVKESTPRPK